MALSQHRLRKPCDRHTRENVAPEARSCIESIATTDSPQRADLKSFIWKMRRERRIFRPLRKAECAAIEVRSIHDIALFLVNEADVTVLTRQPDIKVNLGPEDGLRGAASYRFAKCGKFFMAINFRQEDEKVQCSITPGFAQNRVILRK